MKNVWIIDEEGATWVFDNEKDWIAGIISETKCGMIVEHAYHAQIPSARLMLDDEGRPNDETVDYVMRYCQPIGVEQNA
jgi:hypothetical protein